MDGERGTNLSRIDIRFFLDGRCKMKKFATTVFLLFSILVMSEVFGQEAGMRSKMGIGINAGFQKLYGESEVEPTGFSPAGEVLAKYLLNDRVHLAVALGFGYLNDGPINIHKFNTNLITGDLRVNVNLLPPSKVSPFVTFGLGAFSFKYNKVAAGTPLAATFPQRYYDGAFFVGGGLEYRVKPKLGVGILTDYRFTTGDDLDGMNTGPEKDGYLNGRAGVTYYFASPTEAGADKDLLALESVDLGDLGDMGDLGLPADSNENLDIFEAKLDKLEESDAGFSMEHYIRLKSRVDELNQLIAEKEAALEDLRTSLDLKDQRIADLEAELERMGSRGYTGPVTTSDFTTGYEEALRSYYSRSFDVAINIFQQLKDNYPNHRLASNAQYWIGESQFGMGNYSAAAQAFQAVFNYPESFKKDDATIMLGRCYYQMKDMETARTYFQELINNYPDSEYVPKAQMWLNRIG